MVLQIWDTAGTERYASVSSTFYRGADIVIFVFDITNHQTFKALEYWESKFREVESDESIPYLLAANKCDDENTERTVGKDEIDSFCKKFNIESEGFIEVSAKNNVNTNKLFETTAAFVVKHRAPTKKHSRRDSIRLLKPVEGELDEKGRKKKDKCNCSIM